MVGEGNTLPFLPSCTRARPRKFQPSPQKDRRLLLHAGYLEIVTNYSVALKNYLLGERPRGGVKKWNSI